jgi:hypothetical protein
VSPQERAAGEGIEAERRLAYVAFTRAQRELAVHSTTGAASRFLTESGLVAPVTIEPPPPPPPPRSRSGKGGRSGGRRRRGAVARVVAEAERVGLARALQSAPSYKVALEGAAEVIEVRRIGPKTALGRMSVLELLGAIDQLDEHDSTALLKSAGIDNGHRHLKGLHGRTRARLARALRDLAAAQ